MLKADSLRETLTRANKWCRANPEAFTVFVEEGNIETTGETPSFMYRYTLVLFVMNFAGDIDDFTLPLMAWLWHNQPDLLLNPEKNRDIKFTTLINNDDTADILFEMPIRERVRVTLDENGIPRAEHLPEPKPRIVSDGDDWRGIFDAVTWEADAHE
ncbi:phage tail protein [Serratia symbiotica]|uniref:Phage tail protein n=1 Tax=Serratia symbiotica TaxID=138074 RepID=A0A7D5ST98_9GAMM|nr:phage tail protein [Serratia symbiotica]MBF1996438.1 phage tail protein [Serratia symbiotica]QLH63318.1 phage tail protein [Serratia symbiotica]